MGSELDAVTVDGFCIEIIESFIVAFFVDEGDIGLAGVGHSDRVNSDSFSHSTEGGELFLNFLRNVHLFWPQILQHW